MIEFSGFMAAHGERLIDNGYPILPIVPGKKIPGKWRDDEWHFEPGWQRHCERPTKQFEVDIWKRWPGCCIGLACGTVIGIDIDIFDDPNKPGYPKGEPGEDAELALGAERLAREMLGDTPAIRIGRAPKRALFYRAASPFKGRKLHPFEVYGLGSQMVIYAVHPDTGRPYEWPDEGLTEIDVSRLPAITEAQAMAWLEEAYKRTPEKWRPKTIATLSGGERPAFTGPTDPTGTYEAVRSALAYIPNEDLDGSSWIKMGNAIKAALGEKGRDLWLDWSKSSNKSGASGKGDTAERRWATMRPTSVGAGSIYWLAEQRGWRPDADMILNGHEAELAGGIHPAAGLIAKLQERERQRDAGATLTAGIDPIIFDGLDGLLADYHKWIVTTSRSPQPFLALGASIVAIGAAAGRRYRSATNIRTNVMVVGMADSGGGKDRPLSCITDGLTEAGLAEYVGGSKLASGSGLLSALRDHPVQVFGFDEIGHMMGINSSKGAGAHKAEILPLLTEIWSKAGGRYLGTNYADTKLNAKAVLYNPHVCLFGATVPGVFWKAFSSGAMADGSLARYLLFQSPENYPRPVDDLPPLDAPDAVVDGLRAVAGHGGGGNLSDAGVHILMSSTEAYGDIITVDATPEADAAMRARSEEEWNLKRRHEGTPRTAFLARLYEHTIRLAMIKAIGRDPEAPVITGPDMRWACALVDHCIRTMLRETEDRIADNEIEARHKLVFDVIKRAGTIERSALKRKIRTIKKDELDDILDTLIQSCQIVVGSGDAEGPGRKAITYTCATIDERVL